MKIIQKYFPFFKNDSSVIKIQIMLRQATHSPAKPSLPVYVQRYEMELNSFSLN